MMQPLLFAWDLPGNTAQKAGLKGMSAAKQTLRSLTSGPSKPRLLKLLGPGLISGASDDDPTAIATYSQAGAHFGFGLCWFVPFCYPIMSVVQEVSARIEHATGLRGLAGSPRRSWL